MSIAERVDVALINFKYAIFEQSLLCIWAQIMIKKENCTYLFKINLVSNSSVNLLANSCITFLEINQKAFELWLVNIL